jgi:hypothetical protein
LSESDYGIGGTEQYHHREVLTAEVCQRLSNELEQSEKDLGLVTPLAGLADALSSK